MSGFLGENGSGLRILGLRELAPGQYAIYAVQARIDGALLPARKAGFGGERYIRSVLETAFVARTGGWTERVMQDAGRLLLHLDGGEVVSTKAEIWDYRSDQNEQVQLTSKSRWLHDLTAAFEHRTYPEKEASWPGLLAAAVAQAKAELLLPDASDTWLAGKAANDHPITLQSKSKDLLGLLRRQALLERQFLIAAAEGDERAWPLFHDLVSARYIRTLCLLHRCERTKWQQEILWPEISELGRTILLLSCCGWLKEAGELTHRARHMILSHQNQFVPLVPWFGIVWGTQNPEVLVQGAVAKFHQPTYGDVDWVLRNWQGDDLEQLAARLARISDRRRWTMGQFDDEYHIDFDDGFSWTIPYEAGAVLMARKAKGLPVPEMDHPIFDLPTARFDLARGLVTQHQDLYARFIREI